MEAVHAVPGGGRGKSLRLAGRMMLRWPPSRVSSGHHASAVRPTPEIVPRSRVRSTLYRLLYLRCTKPATVPCSAARRLPQLALCCGAFGSRVVLGQLMVVTENVSTLAGGLDPLFDSIVDAATAGSAWGFHAPGGIQGVVDATRGEQCLVTGQSCSRRILLSWLC